MAKILFAAQPTAGHTNALRAMGRLLLKQGHSVAISIAEVKLPFAKMWPEVLQVAAALPPKLAADGIELLPLKNLSPSALWYGGKIPRSKGQEELDAALHLFTAGLVGQTKSVGKHITDWQPDIVVGDYLLPAAMLAAELHQIPYVAFYHSALPFPVEGAAPFGCNLPVSEKGSHQWKAAEAKAIFLNTFYGEEIDKAAVKLGLPKQNISLFNSPVSKTLNLLATAPILEPSVILPKGPIVMTGPCLPEQLNVDKNSSALSSFNNNDGEKIYLSLGTVFNDKPEVFNVILDGLSPLKIQTIVSAGASYENLLPHAKENIHIFKQVPQVPLLKQVDLVITHGGNNTVQETLAAGKPMVVIPFGGDQIVNAQRVVRLGVGTCILPEQLNSKTLKEAVQELLSV